MNIDCISVYCDDVHDVLLADLRSDECLQHMGEQVRCSSNKNSHEYLIPPMDIELNVKKIIILLINFNYTIYFH